MAKDLEKANKTLEKQNKKLKKKNKRGGVVILVLLLIIVLLFLAVFLFDPLGFGNGMGILLNDKTGDAPQLELETASQTEEVQEAPAVANVNVTVSGKTYLLEGTEAAVDDIISSAKAAEGDVLVRITNDSATANAMQALLDALDENKISYTMVSMVSDE